MDSELDSVMEYENCSRERLDNQSNVRNFIIYTEYESHYTDFPTQEIVKRQNITAIQSGAPEVP